jgi:hypothetical protein
MRPAAPQRAQPPCTRALAEARREEARVARLLPALLPGRHYVLAPPGPAAGLGPAPARTTLAPAAAGGRGRA